MTRSGRPGAWRRFRAMSGRAQLFTWVGLLFVLLLVPTLFGQVPGANSGSGAPAVSSAAGPTSPGSPSTAATAAPPSSTIPTILVTTTTVPIRSGSSPCRTRGSGSTILPDPKCTPGAVNSEVTQANIASTICRVGWTATVRPPESYTYDLKVEQMTAYGESGPTSAYEEDHLIPLELGGSPDSPLNLWPEPGGSPNQKDGVENAAKYAVCDGKISLAYAQQAIATDWVAFGLQLGVRIVTNYAVTLGPVATSSVTAMPAVDYRAGEFCPQAKIGETVSTPAGPLTCEVASDPSHPRWMHG